jgi:hypothetical protein
MMKLLSFAASRDPYRVEAFRIRFVAGVLDLAGAYHVVSTPARVDHSRSDPRLNGKDSGSAPFLDGSSAQTEAERRPAILSGND